MDQSRILPRVVATAISDFLTGSGSGLVLHCSLGLDLMRDICCCSEKHGLYDCKGGHNVRVALGR